MLLMSEQKLLISNIVIICFGYKVSGIIIVKMSFLSDKSEIPNKSLFCVYLIWKLNFSNYLEVVTMYFSLLVSFKSILVSIRI